MKALKIKHKQAGRRIGSRAAKL